MVRTFHIFEPLLSLSPWSIKVYAILNHPLRLCLVHKLCLDVQNGHTLVANLFDAVVPVYEFFIAIEVESYCSGESVGCFMQGLLAFNA